MIIPIADENVQNAQRPWISYALITINVLIFLFEASMPREQLEQFTLTYGAIPVELTNGQDLYTLISSMFLHGGWIHLLGNMAFLWIFADNIEALIGKYYFILFYVIGGFCATLAHVLTDPGSQVPMIGASGAISAIMGIYLVLFYASRIKVLFLLIFRPFVIPAWLFLGIWIAQQLMSGIGTLNTTAEGNNVAWWAHIGGFAFGVLIGLLVRKRLSGRYRYVSETKNNMI